MRRGNDCDHTMERRQALAATGEKKSRKRLNPPKGGGMTSGPKNGARTWLADASTPSQHGAG